MDKSSSMEGRKMELARLAAIGVIENLRPIDMVGVLIFDNSYLWAVPIRKAEDKILIKRLVAGVTPDTSSDQVRIRISPYLRLIAGIHMRTTNAAAACMPTTTPITDADNPIARPWIGM